MVYKFYGYHVWGVVNGKLENKWCTGQNVKEAKEEFKRFFGSGTKITTQNKHYKHTLTK